MDMDTLVKEFVSGRMSYDVLLTRLKDVAVQSDDRAEHVHGALAGAVEAGRLPNDLAQIIRTQLPRPSSGAAGETPSIAARDTPADAAVTPAYGGEDDDIDEPTIPHGVHANMAQSAKVSDDGTPAQPTYLPPLPYLTSPPAEAGDEMRDKVDDVVLGSLVDGFRDFRKARDGEASEPSAQARPEKVDQFLTDYKSARLRSDARKAAAGSSPGAKDLESLTKGTRARAGVGALLRDRFVLDREIGRGAMGVVYAAVDRRRLEAGHSEPYVALKLLGDDVHADADALRQLEAEARKAQMLAHPNIVTIHDFDRDDGEVFIVMELLKGTPLDRKLSESPGRALRSGEAEPILKGMCEGLIYAHSQDVVHSDLKPGNVFVQEHDNVKLLDFGLAAATAATTEKEGLASGLTAAYASPEMFENAARDPRDDIFALGCITYQILSGRHPFSMKGSDEAAREELTPEPLKRKHKKVWPVLAKALAFKRDDRLESVSLLKEALFD